MFTLTAAKINDGNTFKEDDIASVQSKERKQEYGSACRNY